jgi:hypothetical protein
MLRNTHVPEMMARVEAALARGATEGAGDVHYVTPDDHYVDLAGLRHLANIQIEFASGSARPVVGPAVRFGKRALRRLLRWYVKPIMEQQTRFNHAALDLVEKLRVQNERLAVEVESLRRARSTVPEEPDGTPPAGG